MITNFIRSFKNQYSLIFFLVYKHNWKKILQKGMKMDGEDLTRIEMNRERHNQIFSI